MSDSDTGSDPLATDQWPNRAATYASECGNDTCDNHVAIKLRVTDGQRKAVWCNCGECGHTNWLQKQ